jgi:hypothetical protein
VVLVSARWSDSEPTGAVLREMNLSCEQTIWHRGVCVPALEPRGKREGLRTRYQGFKPDLGNSAVRHYRGASENVAMAELQSALAEMPRLREENIRLRYLLQEHGIQIPRLTDFPLPPEHSPGRRQVCFLGRSTIARTVDPKMIMVNSTSSVQSHCSSLHVPARTAFACWL